MNGKKAKMLRKAGKVDKKVKRMFNSLSPNDKHTLSLLYKSLIAQTIEEESKAS